MYVDRKNRMTVCSSLLHSQLIGKACATGDGSKGREFRRANRALAKKRVRLTLTGDPLSCIAWFLEFGQRAKVLAAA